MKKDFTNINKNTEKDGNKQMKNIRRILGLVLVIVLSIGLIGCTATVTAPEVENKEVVKEIQTVEGKEVEINGHKVNVTENGEYYSLYDTLFTKLSGTDSYRDTEFEKNVNGFFIYDDGKTISVELKEELDVKAFDYANEELKSLVLKGFVYDKEIDKLVPIYFPTNETENTVKNAWSNNLQVGLTEEEFKETYGVTDGYVKYELGKIVQFK